MATTTKHRGMLFAPEMAKAIEQWADAVGPGTIVRCGVGRAVCFARSGFTKHNTKLAREQLPKAIRLAKEHFERVARPEIAGGAG